MLRKIAILLILLSIPLCANASDGKGWYPFMQNKGWYPWQGQSSSTENKEEPLVQPTTQNSSSNSAQPTTNASSQSGNQQTQSNQTQSSWFNK